MSVRTVVAVVALLGLPLARPLVAQSDWNFSDKTAAPKVEATPKPPAQATPAARHTTTKPTRAPRVARTTAPHAAKSAAIHLIWDEPAPHAGVTLDWSASDATPRAHDDERKPDASSPERRQQ
jgi:hypothetical protein